MKGVSSKCFGNFLRFFDYFGVIFTFKMKENKMYQSRFGGVIFIIFLVFSIQIFVQSLLDFYNHVNYNINYSVAVLNSSPELNFNNAGFNLTNFKIHYID